MLDTASKDPGQPLEPLEPLAESSYSCPVLALWTIIFKFSKRVPEAHVTFVEQIELRHLLSRTFIMTKRNQRLQKRQDTSNEQLYQV